MGERELYEMRPLLLSIDNAAVRARRVVERRIESAARALAEKTTSA